MRAKEPMKQMKVRESPRGGRDDFILQEKWMEGTERIAVMDQVRIWEVW